MKHIMISCYVKKVHIWMKNIIPAACKGAIEAPADAISPPRNMEACGELIDTGRDGCEWLCNEAGFKDTIHDHEKNINLKHI